MSEDDKISKIKKTQKVNGKRKKKKKKKKMNLKWLVTLIALILFYAAVLLLSSPFLKSSFINYKSVDFEYSINNELPPIISKTEEIHPPTVKEALETEKPAGDNVIGKISIPSVGIDLPIFAGITNQNLLFGTVSMYLERDPLIDNIVILGHHLGFNGKLFSELLNVKENDKVDVLYLGENYTYNVIETALVSETEIGILDNTKDDVGLITLVTCDKPDETDKRYIVRAKIAKDSDDKSVSSDSESKKNVIKTINKQAFTSKDWMPVIIVGMILIVGTIFIPIILK